MPKGKKVGGKDWEKGQSGNPNGRPPLPPDVREARRLTTEEFTKLANKYLYMTEEEITAVLGGSPVLMEQIVAKMALAAGENVQKADWFLNRLIGKVPDVIDATFNAKKLTDEELLEASKEAMKLLAAKGEI